MEIEMLGDREKVYQYLQVIEDRILNPIKYSGIQSSCTGTLLMLFAAINGLGKLIKESKDTTTSITNFLQFMGGEYKVKCKKLITLRHCLMHNAINFESVLSHFQPDSSFHLQEFGNGKYLYVNTTKMTMDFEEGFSRFKQGLESNGTLMEYASKQLENKGNGPHSEKIDIGIAIPSLAPSVQFVLTIKRGKCT